MRTILPTSLGGFGSPSHRPQWRSWTQGQPQTVTPAELVDGVTNLLARAVKDAGEDPARWKDLVNHIASLPAANRDRLLAAFEALDPNNLGDDGRVEVWRALVGLSARHRRFAGTPWAMPGDVVSQVETVSSHLAPASLVDLYADLFGHRPHLPGTGRRDFAAYDQALRAARRDAAGAILDSGGLAEMLRLGATADLPAAAGWAAAGARIEAEGLEWMVRQLQRWPDGASVQQQTGLLLAVPTPTAALIAIVDGLHADVRAAFWERMVPMRADAQARAVVVARLIEHGRAWAAIGVLVMMIPTNGSTGLAPGVGLVESSLLAAATDSSVDPHQAASLSSEVSELLDYLESCGSDVQTRARLEFLFTNLLHFTRPARALDEALRTDPALFAEIASYVYRAEDDPQTMT